MSKKNDNWRHFINNLKVEKIAQQVISKPCLIIQKNVAKAVSKTKLTKNWNWQTNNLITSGSISLTTHWIAANKLGAVCLFLSLLPARSANQLPPINHTSITTLLAPIRAYHDMTCLVSPQTTARHVATSTISAGNQLLSTTFQLWQAYNHHCSLVVSSMLFADALDCGKSSNDTRSWLSI